MNLWRDIPCGEKPPEILNMIVEVVSGSRDKYEYNIKWETFVLDRIIPSSVVFPVEYGFVPQTWFDDEDPLDEITLVYSGRAQNSRIHVCGVRGIMRSSLSLI